MDTRGVPVIETSLNGGAHEDSDVFVCRPLVTGLGGPHEPTPTGETRDVSVTLFVFGWHNVEPGPLSWAFPSLKTAMDAVKTMKNAAQWCICSGNDWSSMDAARTSGAVLVEQLG